MTIGSRIALPTCSAAQGILSLRSHGSLARWLQLAVAMQM